MSNPMPAPEAPMSESEGEGECTCPQCGAKLTIQAKEEEQMEPEMQESGNEAAMKKVAAYTGEE